MDRSILQEHKDWPDEAHAFGALLASRFSCRAYRATPLSRSVIDNIVRLAQFAPSWCNTQPWQVVVTEGLGTAQFVGKLHTYATGGTARPQPDLGSPSTYAGIYDKRRKECAWQLYGSLGIVRDDRAASRRQSMENFRLFGAPHAAIITTDVALGQYGAVDCGVFLANFLLAAQSFGVSTTPQASLAFFSPFVRDYFSISPDRAVVCGIALGYADYEHAANRFRTNRAEVADVVEYRSGN